MRLESVLDGEVAVVMHRSPGGRGAVQGLEAWLEAFTFADWIGGRAQGEWGRVLKGCKGQGRLYLSAEAIKTGEGASGRVVERGAGVQAAGWLVEAASFDDEAVLGLPPGRDYLWVHSEEQ